MIIKYPTGLYRSILPKTESGNIVYTISNNAPPTTPIKIIQFPVFEELTPAPDKIFSDSERRAQFGELIYTITTSDQNEPGSNSKLFEVGETLSFEEFQDNLEPVRSPNRIEIRHNTNILNLEAAGLSADDIELLTRESEIKLDSLQKEFNQTNAEFKDVEIMILENQKRLNEANKAIKATRQVFDIRENDVNNPNEIYQKLLNTINGLNQTKSELVIRRMDLSNKLNELTSSIYKLSELVR